MKSRFLFLVVVSLLLGGCVRVDIGGEQKPTLGRQMMDLHRAKESGAISDKEFKRLQVRILEGAGG